LAELELPAFVEVLLGELADKYLIFKDNWSITHSTGKLPSHL
jgi:hypothetical protein